MWTLNKTYENITTLYETAHNPLDIDIRKLYETFDDYINQACDNDVLLMNNIIKDWCITVLDYTKKYNPSNLLNKLMGLYNKYKTPLFKFPLVITINYINNVVDDKCSIDNDALKSIIDNNDRVDLYTVADKQDIFSKLITDKYTDASYVEQYLRTQNYNLISKTRTMFGTSYRTLGDVTKKHTPYTVSPEIKTYNFKINDKLDKIVKELARGKSDTLEEMTKYEIGQIAKTSIIESNVPESGLENSFVFDILSDITRNLTRTIDYMVDNSIEEKKLFKILNSISDNLYSEPFVNIYTIPIMVVGYSLMNNTNKKAYIKSFKNTAFLNRRVKLNHVDILTKSPILESVISALLLPIHNDISYINSAEYASENNVTDDNNTISLSVLTEGFEVRRDGTIVINLSDNTTFTDEYASNHNLLKYNESQGNYEGMKYNLVYHMILVENIEREVIYNPKFSRASEVYKDAMRARRLIKNDLATYLPKMKRYVKNFDINKLYSESKAEKNRIEINTVDTISGIKIIIKSILL